MSNSAESLRNNSADILASGSGVGGLRRGRGGRVTRENRDFVASSNASSGWA